MERVILIKQFRPSVCHAVLCKTAKRIGEILSLTASHIILVFCDLVSVRNLYGVTQREPQIHDGYKNRAIFD